MKWNGCLDDYIMSLVDVGSLWFGNHYNINIIIVEGNCHDSESIRHHNAFK